MFNYSNALSEVLNILASPANEQLGYLRRLNDPCVSELALEFSDLFLLASDRVDTGELSQGLFESLKALDLQLDKMSDDKHNWTDESLADSKEWEQVRQLAAASLVYFG